LAFGTFAATGLLFVLVPIAAGIQEPDGNEGLAPPEDGGLAVGLGHFEAGMNWLTFAGGFLWAAATPTCTLRGWTTRLSPVAAALGVALMAFVVLYALDDATHWDGGQDNGRPWLTIGLAALAGLATWLGRLVGRHAPGPDAPATP
jgi:hypothetical protein